MPCVVRRRVFCFIPNYISSYIELIKLLVVANASIALLDEQA